MVSAGTHAGQPGFDLPYLAAWRRWHGFTQEELARAAGMSADQIRAIEQHRSRAGSKVIRQITAALGVSRVALLHLPPEREGEPEWRKANAARAAQTAQERTAASA